MQEAGTLKIKDLFDGLTSLTFRTSGLKVRLQIEETLKDKECVILDFDGIELISQGFADEVVGVFVREKGLDFVKQKIKVVNANELVRGMLNWVVSYSKEMMTQSNENHPSL